MDMTVNGEPVPETTGNALIRSEDIPGGHVACDTAIGGLRAGRDEAREQLTRAADAANVVLDLFTRGSDGYRARISGVNLMRAYKAIGRPVPDRLKHLEGQ